jgi:hypothetical protein
VGRQDFANAPTQQCQAFVNASIRERVVPNRGSRPNSRHNSAWSTGENRPVPVKTRARIPCEHAPESVKRSRRSGERLGEGREKVITLFVRCLFFPLRSLTEKKNLAFVCCSKIRRNSMSSTRSTANPETGDVSVNASRPSSSFFQKPLAVSANFAEQGLQVFNQEQGCVDSENYLQHVLMETSTSVSAPGATRTVRKDGGIPSSPAFAAEQAKDAHRFAALDLETRDQSVSLRYDLGGCSRHLPCGTAHR